MKKRKIGELNMPNMPGIFTIYEERGKTNPYSIYYTFYGRDEYGCYSKHKRLVERYANYPSVMAHMADMALGSVYGRCFNEKGEMA